MRFGSRLHQNIIPHFEPFYINYDGAKRLFRLACLAARDTIGKSDFFELSLALSHDLGNIEAFYLRQQKIIKRKLKAFFTQYGSSTIETSALDGMDLYELNYSLAYTLEIFESLETLLWYGKVNRDGFRNIFRKLKKTKISNDFDLHELQTRFDQAQFSTQNQCLEDLEHMSDVIAQVIRAASTRERYTKQGDENAFAQMTYSAIHENEPSALVVRLRDDCPLATRIHSDQRTYYLSLLRYSTLRGSQRCTEQILSKVRSLKDDVTGTNCLHDLFICFGLGKKLKEHRQYFEAYATSPYSVEADTYDYFYLEFFLNQLEPDQYGAVIDVDFSGRTPLHYSASLGLEDICRLFVQYFQRVAPSLGLTPLVAVLSRDFLDYTPLDLAVIGRHFRVVKTVLDCLEDCNELKDASKARELQALLNSLLELAVRVRSFEIVQILIAKKADVNYVGLNGQSPLYIAAQSGQKDCVQFFLTIGASNAVHLNTSESINGRTPLIAACVNGFISIAKMLLEAGADFNVRDHSGWTAKEHALFRGHIKMEDWTSGPITEGLVLSPAVARFYGSVVSSETSFNGLRNEHEKLLSSLSSSEKLRRNYDAEKGKYRILITLGASDERNMQKAVDLKPCLFGHPYSNHPENGFVIEVSATGANGPSEMAALPVLEDMTNEPWMFTCDESEKISIVFKVFRILHYGNDEKTFIGSGIALLEEMKTQLQLKYRTLVKDTTIPILKVGSLEMIGTVTFNFLIITPFETYTKIPKQFQGFWKADGPIQLVGHRGSGANSDTQTNLQIGENTLQSFLTAVKLGASAVEFDVQLTKDLVPVIYHDFLVKEFEGGIPLHDLTLQQFRGLNKLQYAQVVKSRMAEIRYFNRTRADKGHQHKPRSRSFGRYDDYDQEGMFEYVRNASDSKEGARDNGKVNSIKDVFPTLEDLLVKLPDSIAFDIEMKYPMLWEIQDRDMQPYAIDANIFVETVLKKIYALGGNRKITFSSFSPEMCILLSKKQQDYPVLFISKAGYLPVGDVRAESLQQAIQFAKRWNLAGVVMLSSPLVLCPRLVQYTKSSKLICSSYGNMNDDPRHARIQADAGLDAIIVNKVRLISRTLSKEI